MAVLDIIINTAAHAAARPLLAQKGGTRPGSPPLMTAGDGWDGNVSLRLWFYNAESGAITSTNVRKAGVSLSLYAKQSRTEAAPYLFEVAGFSEFQDGEGNYGYEAPVNLNTVELLAAVASGSSADAWVDVVEDGDATTQFQVTIRPQVDSGGAHPSPAEPPYPHPSQLALKSDLDALRGGVPLTGWANSTAYPFGTCTITGGIPTALEFAGVTYDFAYAELALTDFAPDTLDISGTVTAGTVELTELSLVFLDGAGAEAGTIGALTIGAAFSFASVVVPSGAVKVAVKALGTAATSSLSAGFSALSVTAHANLSELTAEALDAILAYKAQAESDAGTVAALVPPAQTNAQTIADLVAPAQADASAVSGYAATAAAAVANMEVAPLNSVASSSQVVRGSDPRLGLRGGVALTVGGTSATPALQPVAPFALNSLGLVLSAGFGASSAQSRFLFSTGSGTATSDIRVLLVGGAANTLRIDEGNGAGAYTQTTKTFPAGASSLWFVHDSAAGTITCYTDSSDTPAFTHSRVNATTLNGVAYIGGIGSTNSYTGTVRAVCALNFAATVAERIAAMRGEYPQAWLGGATTSAAFAGAWTDSSFTSGGGTITVNAGGTLSASCSATTADNAINATLAAAPQPLLRPGRVVRLRYLLTVNSGTAPTIKIQQGNAVSGYVALTPGASSLTDVAVTLEGLAADPNIKLRIQTVGASNFTLSNVSVEILGAQLLVGPQDWARTRGVDMSGNCNDLVYGTGVVAIEPATKARVIAATAAGATVSAGAVATVGTLSGATYRDAKALAALRQWDSVSANWRQARPANCAAIQAAVTANGTPLVEATALASGSCPVSANAPINLIHTIN